MARTTVTASLAPTRATPQARIDPAEQVAVFGTLPILDGRGSTVDPEEDLTFQWSVEERPVGSEVTSVTSLEEGRVTLSPDLPGVYVLGLVVSTATRSSSKATATVRFQRLSLFHEDRSTPDGAFFFKTLSDVWRQTEHAAMLPRLWSGYLQVVGNDLLTAWETLYNRSLDRIQLLSQRRWQAVSPKLDLPDGSSLRYGGSVGGEDAFTTGTLGLFRGILLSPTEVRVVSGVVEPGAVGGTLTIHTLARQNQGTYTIRALTSDGSGYLLSSATTLPAPRQTWLQAGRVRCLVGVDTLQEATQLFAGVAQVGDVLRIEQDANQGLYTVLAVGVADGLPNDRTVQVDRPPSRASASARYTLYRPVSGHVTRVDTAVTDTVYLPASTTDLTPLLRGQIQGEGTLLSARELVVPARHRFRAAIGSSLTIRTGVNTGWTGTLLGFNTSNTGYILSKAVEGPFPLGVQYAIAGVHGLVGRVITVAGQAFQIRAVHQVSTQAVVLGGRGPVWVLQLDRATLPIYAEALSWHLGGTLYTPGLSLSEAGVSPGDVLRIRVRRMDTQAEATVPAQILGAVGSYAGFELGTEEGVLGEGTLTATEGTAFAAGWGLSEQWDEETEVASGALATLATLWASRAFRTRNFHTPVDDVTRVDLGMFEGALGRMEIIRNAQIRVEDRVRGVPTLTEYIAEPRITVGDTITVLPWDDVPVTVDRAPVFLIENQGYTLDTGSFFGTGAQTTEGSARVVLAGALLLSRYVAPGDQLVLLTGGARGIYTLVRVEEDGVEVTPVPEATATATYQIRRLVEDVRVRFLPGLFTTRSPAPDRLWAETLLLDNTPIVEANFGRMVGLTHAEWVAYGTQQTSYVSAVRALAYAQTQGAALETIRLAISAVLGLPFSEFLGRVVSIEEPYTPGAGRIRIEALTPDGKGTGRVAAYHYPLVDADTPEEFAGRATNPTTGAPYALHDVVPAFRVLSNGVQVLDRLVQEELRLTGIAAFHAWEVRVDRGVAMPEDLALVDRVVAALRPIYTRATVYYVMYFLDEIQMEDTLRIAIRQSEVDATAFSMEDARSNDDENGASFPLRYLDFGVWRSRTLFQGYDLACTGATFVSARGGFVSNTSYAPSEAWPELQEAGTRLIRAADDVSGVPGDVVFVSSNGAMGAYEVVEVVSDTTLTVRQVGTSPSTLPALGPLSPDPALLSATGQVFQIARLVENPLAVGEGTVSTGSRIVATPDANFRTNGIAVDDVLVVLTGVYQGRHRILAVAEDELTTETVFGSDTTVAYWIVRDGLAVNPVCTAEVTATLGDTQITVPDAPRYGIQQGDRMFVRAGVGADQGREIVVLFVEGEEVYLQEAWDASATYEVDFNRDSLEEEPSSADRGLLSPWDELTLTIYHPVSLVLTVVDGMIVEDTLTSATDFAAAGVTASMWAVLETTANAGHHAILDVVTTTLTLPGSYEDEGPVTVSIVEEDPDFEILDDTVTSVLGVDFEALGVLPGDLLTIAEGSFRVLSVALGVLTLTQSTGINPIDTRTGTLTRQRGQMEG